MSAKAGDRIVFERDKNGAVSAAVLVKAEPPKQPIPSRTPEERAENGRHPAVERGALQFVLEMSRERRAKLTDDIAGIEKSDAITAASPDVGPIAKTAFVAYHVVLRESANVEMTWLGEVEKNIEQGMAAIDATVDKVMAAEKSRATGSHRPGRAQVKTQVA
jgi:hypothetical protein